MIQEEGMPPRCPEGMRELFGAVRYVTSLCFPRLFPAVLPDRYKQFGLTIAFSIAISSCPHLAPSLSALLLRRNRRDNEDAVFRSRDQLVLIGLIALTKCARRMGDRSALVRIRVIVLAVFVALVLTGWLYTVVPTGFPNEDQGYFISIIQAPEASLNYTNDIMRRWKQNY